MNTSKKERQSNIEILRVLAIIGVIVLHYNNRKFGNAFGVTDNIAVNHLFLMILESLCICAVDLFVIISGYFLSKTSRRNAFKVIDLFIEVIAFSVVRYLISTRGHISTYDLLKSLIPNNYFVTLYCVLYIFSPLINFVMDTAGKENRKKIVIMLGTCFCLIPFLVDILNCLSTSDFNGLSTIGAYGNQWGYTIVNFTLLYILGSVLDDVTKIKNYSLIFISIGLVAIIACLSYWNEDIAWSYCSPFVILLACSLFMLFKNLSIGNNKVINELSGGVFTCFLVHTIFLRHIKIEYFAAQSIPVLLIHIVISSILIYAVSYIIWKVYAFCFSVLTRKIDRKIFDINYFE